MITKKELKKFAKKVVDKRIYKKIKALKDDNEQIEALKYSLISTFNLKYHGFDKKVEDIKKEGKDVLFAEAKLHLIPSKIKMFKITFHGDDFRILVKLFEDLEREIGNI